MLAKFASTKKRAFAALLGSCLLLGTGVSYFQRGSELPPSRAFYYWKTQWAPSPEISAALDSHKIEKLYLRFFDVEWDPTRNATFPVSALEVRGPLPKTGVELIPVVYLTNAVFLNIPFAKVESLADHVWKKVSEMAQAQTFTPRHLQLDCDWSDGSRRNYFHFLDVLRRKLARDDVKISATLRLHQIKYAKRTGVPPVHAGMLMFYNFGRIQADSEKSSIFNAADAARYTSYISKYKLPLDISLPLFSWVVHSRDGKVLDLIDKSDSQELDSVPQLMRERNLRYRVLSAFFYRGKYFAQGDLLAVEETDPSLTRLAADLAIQGAGRRKKYQTVAFFDLDERNLNRYGNTEIESIFRKF